ncbi:MAG TPA: hypothetical protein VGC79_32370 [Polyangiaceae bacterium]
MMSYAALAGLPRVAMTESSATNPWEDALEDFHSGIRAQYSPIAFLDAPTWTARTRHKTIATGTLFRG